MIKLYKRKPEYIYVVQFWASSNVEGIKHESVRIDVDESEMMGTFKIDNITVFVHYGDYVQIKDGKPFRRFHKAEFEKLYQEVE